MLPATVLIVIETMTRCRCSEWLRREGEEGDGPSKSQYGIYFTLSTIGKTLLGACFVVMAWLID